jgi:RNA polymerase-interacting CarD/CdnL/TRCF family regulator
MKWQWPTDTRFQKQLRHHLKALEFATQRGGACAADRLGAQWHGPSHDRGESWDDVDGPFAGSNPVDVSSRTGKENRMTFSIGNKVVYPSQGPCLIGALVEKVVAGRPTNFYRLAPLDNSGDAVFVPIDKVSALRIRQLMARSEIPKLLGHLENSVAASKNWKQRDIDNLKLLSSGSAFDLAEIIESLTELNERRALSPRDRETLDKARKFLICEISEVMGESKDVTEEQVDNALKLRKGAIKQPVETVQ